MLFRSFVIKIFFYKFRVSIDLIEEDLNNKEVESLRKYIKEAVQMWGGQLHPHDFLFSQIYLKQNCVKVYTEQE